jgi:hypothetical protein
MKYQRRKQRGAFYVETDPSKVKIVAKSRKISIRKTQYTVLIHHLLLT